MAALVEGNRRLRLGHFETLGLIIGSRRAKTALIMKTLSGTFVFVALAAIGTVAVLTVRPFALATPTPTQADCPPAENAPVLIIMGKDGLQSTKSGDALKAMFDDLIKKCGDKVCNVDYYDKDHPVEGHPAWHKGHRKLVPTAAVRSEASRNVASADPSHLVQQAAFKTTDDAISFFT